MGWMWRGAGLGLRARKAMAKNRQFACSLWTITGGESGVPGNNFCVGNYPHKRRCDTKPQPNIDIDLISVLCPKLDTYSLRSVFARAISCQKWIRSGTKITIQLPTHFMFGFSWSRLLLLLPPQLLGSEDKGCWSKHQAATSSDILSRVSVWHWWNRFITSASCQCDLQKHDNICPPLPTILPPQIQSVRQPTIDWPARIRREGVDYGGGCEVVIAAAGGVRCFINTNIIIDNITVHLFNVWLGFGSEILFVCFRYINLPRTSE